MQQAELNWVNGDAVQLLRREPSELYDSVVTDPPYSSGGLHIGDRQQSTTKKYEQGGTIDGHAEFEGDNRDQRSWKFWCMLWMSEALRVTKDGGRFFCFCDWRQLPTVTDVVQAAGWRWRGILSWDKGNGARAPHSNYFRHQCEYVVWASRGKMEQGKAGHGGPWPGSFTWAVDPRKKWHQTGKPVEVMEWLLEATPRGGRVLDPFGGSASTLVAAANRGINATGYEIEAHYYEIGKKRLAETKRPLFSTHARKEQTTLL